MKRTTFNISTRGGVRAVVGFTFKFSFYDCEDIFYLGAHKDELGRYIVTELETGMKLGVWSKFKKDIVYYVGKGLMKYNRYTFLDIMDKKRDSLINANAIAELLNCKAELYYPANIDEAKRLIVNHWADDTSHVLGADVRPYYQNFIKNLL